MKRLEEILESLHELILSYPDDISEHNVQLLIALEMMSIGLRFEQMNTEHEKRLKDIHALLIDKDLRKCEDFE